MSKALDPIVDMLSGGAYQTSEEWLAAVRADWIAEGRDPVILDEIFRVCDAYSADQNKLPLSLIAVNALSGGGGGSSFDWPVESKKGIFVKYGMTYGSGEGAADGSAAKPFASINEAHAAFPGDLQTFIILPNPGAHAIGHPSWGTVDTTLQLGSNYIWCPGTVLDGPVSITNPTGMGTEINLSFLGNTFNYLNITGNPFFMVEHGGVRVNIMNSVISSTVPGGSSAALLGFAPGITGSMFVIANSVFNVYGSGVYHGAPGNGMVTKASVFNITQGGLGIENPAFLCNGDTLYQDVDVTMLSDSLGYPVIMGQNAILNLFGRTENTDAGRAVQATDGIFYTRATTLLQTDSGASGTIVLILIGAPAIMAFSPFTTNMIDISGVTGGSVISGIGTCVLPLPSDPRIMANTYPALRGQIVCDITAPDPRAARYLMIGNSGVPVNDWVGPF